MAIERSDLVTVPVLDARLASLRGELKDDINVLRGEVKDAKLELTRDIGMLRADMRDIRAELVRWVVLATFGSVALSAIARSWLGA